MRHEEHEPGTREDCDVCRELAYEPGWYKALRDERVGPPDPRLVQIPDPDDVDVDVVIEETPHEPIRRRR